MRMNRQDWQNYKDYLKSLLVPIESTKVVLTSQEFVSTVNNRNLHREISKIR